MATDSRPNRALQICVMPNSIKQIDANTYKVKSQTGHGSYLVINQNGDWKCECPDFVNRKINCKHVLAISLSSTLSELKEKIGNDVLPTLSREAPKPEKCLYCESTNLVKNGSHKSARGRVQRFSCKDCKKKFVLRDAGFIKMRNDPTIITAALDAYYKGMSFRDVADHIKQIYGKEIHYASIIRWVGKYTKIISDYVDSISPIVGDTWNIDEMTLNIDGKREWLWNVLDTETRFLLSSKISKRRDIEDARKPLQEAKERAKVRPLYVVTDGLKAYPDAIMKEFHTIKNPQTKHVRLPSIKEHPNNNLVERLHGTIREREKVMRAMDNGMSSETMIEGHRIYYNYIRPHMGLNGKTPAE